MRELYRLLVGKLQECLFESGTFCFEVHFLFVFRSDATQPRLLPSWSFTVLLLSRSLRAQNISVVSQVNDSLGSHTTPILSGLITIYVVVTSLLWRYAQGCLFYLPQPTNCVQLSHPQFSATLPLTMHCHQF